jgi:hypothetical protein
MAKRTISNATKPTTRVTVTKSRKGQTTRTTTTKSTYRPAARRTPTIRRRTHPRMITNTVYVTRKGHGGAIAAIIIIVLLLLVFGAYLWMNPIVTAAEQQSYFTNQLAALQNGNQNLTAYYLANAGNYNIPLSQSWAVEVTDQNPTSGVIVGQLTITWNGQSQSLSIQDGIVDTGITPTYAVTLTPSEFESFSQTAVSRNTAAGFADYVAYYLTGQLKYTQVR